MNKIRTRFAPSPTGFMHIGNLRTELYAYLFAKKNGGDFLLRIEDTDQERLVDGAVERIYQTLETVGIVPDESPKLGGAFGPYVQSERKPLYQTYAEELVRLGGAYYCFCDKERLASLTDDKGNRKYDKHCLSLSEQEVKEKLASGVPYVIRQNIPTTGKSSYIDLVFGEISVPCEDMEDNVLLKSDGMPTYNFANVVDDHLMQISHVIRGVEYLSSTPKYNLIYDSFGWERPQYIHLTPIMRDERHKLSKREGDAHFEDFMQKGYLPHAVLNYIALLGWSPKNDVEKMTMEELITLFSVEGLSKSGSIFDENKMRWLNALYLRELSEDAFLALATPYFEQSVIKGRYSYQKFAKLLQPRVEILSELTEKVRFLDEFHPYDTALFVHKKMKTDPTIALTALLGAKEALSTLPAFCETCVHDALIAKCEELGLKKGQLLWSVRVGLTGQESTPGGAIEAADLLGKEETLRRLDFSIALLKEQLG